MYFRSLLICITIVIYLFNDTKCRTVVKEQSDDNNISLRTSKRVAGKSSGKNIIADKEEDCNNYDDGEDNYDDDDEDEDDIDYEPNKVEKKISRVSSKKGSSKPSIDDDDSNDTNSVVKPLKKLKPAASKNKEKQNTVSSRAKENKAGKTEVEKSVTDNYEMKIFSSGEGAACSLKLNKDINKDTEPLFMVKDKDGNFNLALPVLIPSENSSYSKGTAAISFDKEETIYVQCPGKGNGVVVSSENEGPSSEITCISGTTVSFHSGKVDEKVDFTKVSCSKAVPGSVIFNEDGKTCGNNMGKLLEIGFLVEGWHKLIDVCYNVEEATTLYASHKLFGSVLAGADIYNKRPSFTKGLNELYKDFNPNDCYRQESQKEVILELTGDDNYIQPSSNLYLARGHFSPDGDYIYKTWQDATYFYINAGPQWQCINQGHWLAVENLSRDAAMKLKEDLDVTTGPYGVMELKNKQGEYEKLFLRPIKPKKAETKSTKKNQKEENSLARIPVPEYYFKILHRPSKNECIVFISTNNPFIDSPIEFCTNICEENDWPTLQDLRKGFVFCCKYEEFIEVVPYTTKYNCSGGVLRRP